VSAKKVVTTYAKSLFQSISFIKVPKIDYTIESNLGKRPSFVPTVYIIGEELSLTRSILTSSKTLKEFFSNPTYVEKQKLDIILSIFPGLTMTSQAFFRVLTERGHLSLIPEISDEYNQILLKFKNCTKVKIITASSLNENSGSILLNSLKTLTGADDVILTMSYNPKLLGGLIVEYGSSSVDASILKEFSLFFNEV
jgi:F-type H+-transporting ATPase subunit delta